MAPEPPPLTPRQHLESRAARALRALPPAAQVRLSGRPRVRIDGQTLEPEIQLMLALLERRGDEPLETLTPARARALTRERAAIVRGTLPAVGSVRELAIDGAAGPLAARHYAPDEPGGAGAPPPLLVYLHGGGWVVGDLDTHDTVCRMLCRHAGVHVLAVDYRLAPEHPFPAPLDDACAALRWACEHAAELGADPARVAIGGDSAGGNLATVATRLAVHDGGPRPALQLLIYPATDATRRRRSRELFATGFFLTEAEMEWFFDHYLARADRADPRVSPLLADDLSGLPPAYVMTAGFDVLRDEGEEYAEALRTAGTPVALRRFPGLIHGVVNTCGSSPVARDALIEIAGGVRALLALGEPS